MPLKKTSLIVFIALFALACKRKEFKSYLGEYECRKVAHTWELGSPNEYVITEEHLIEVTRNGNLVQVLGENIDIDAIEPEMEYKEGPDDNCFTVLFRNDSIFFSEISSFGTFGFVNTYLGVKIAK